MLDFNSTMIKMSIIFIYLYKLSFQIDDRIHAPP